VAILLQVVYNWQCDCQLPSGNAQLVLLSLVSHAYIDTDYKT